MLNVDALHQKKKKKSTLEATAQKYTGNSKDVWSWIVFFFFFFFLSFWLSMQKKWGPVQTYGERALWNSH